MPPPAAPAAATSFLLILPILMLRLPLLFALISSFYESEDGSEDRRQFLRGMLVVDVVSIGIGSETVS